MLNIIFYSSHEDGGLELENTMYNYGVVSDIRCTRVEGDPHRWTITAFADGSTKQGISRVVEWLYCNAAQAKDLFGDFSITFNNY